MGVRRRRLARPGRGGRTVALLSLSGLLLASCSSLGRSQTNAARAIPASDKIEVLDNFSAPELEQKFEDVSRRVSRAVVAISATEATVETDATLRSDDINPDRLAGVLDAVDRTVGTGFVVDADGYIVTNDHVVAKAQQLWVTTDAHKVFPAIVVGSDPRADLAVLKIPATQLPVAHFAAQAARRGQWTIAIGNPYGLAGGGDMAVSVGIVSATNRALPRLSGKEDRLYSNLIQTTAQINPGNSGGPLFDLSGDVIGINTAVILPQKQTNGIGFAIPADAHVLRIIDNLKQGHEVIYGYLGVKVSSPTPRERREAGVEEEDGDGDGGGGGARVESVETDSPAAAAHVKVGDIIVRLDGDAVHDSDDFVRLIGLCPVGEPVKAVVYRHGAIALSLSLRARQTPPETVTRESQRFRWRGMLLGPIPAKWNFEGGSIAAPAAAAAAPAPARRPNAAAGIMVIGIDAHSPFVIEGIKAGSIITAVAGHPIHDIAELQRIINDTPASQCRIESTNPPAAVVSARD